jgi:DNA-binding NarL/FixJ family response regulator
VPGSVQTIQSWHRNVQDNDVGLQLSCDFQKRMPKIKLIFMTMNEDPELVGEAFRAGASGFLLKQAAAFELMDAIEKVLTGGSYVTPSAADGQANIFLRGAQGPRSRRRTYSSTAGSHSTFGGGTFHERGRLGPANH